MRRLVENISPLTCNLLLNPIFLKIIAVSYLFIDAPLAVHTQFSTKTIGSCVNSSILTLQASDLCVVTGNSMMVSGPSIDGNNQCHKSAEPSTSSKYTSTRRLSKNFPQVCSDHSNAIKGQ